MTVTLIINIVLLGIVVICAWQGFKKGIIMGIAEVLVIILALYGARLLSDTFSYEVIPVMKPFVSGVMDTRVEKTAYEVLGYEADENGNYNVTQSLTDLMASMPEARREISRWAYSDLGVYDAMAETMADHTVEYMDQNDASLGTGITQILCETVSWYGGFFIAFIILFTIMIVVINIPNLSFRIPYIGIVNDLGGLVIGVYTGLIFCSLLVWMLQFTGIVLPQETLKQAGAAAWLLDKDLLSTLITL